MKELGDYLKSVRKSNGVGIEEASEDLNITVNVLENIECGNTRAFKDILEMKETVKKYAKYLGLDSEKVIDEFNDFMFEHTSKINLADILEAEEKSKKSHDKKVYSPYTKPNKVIKINKNYDTFYVVLGGILLLIIIVLILKIIFAPKNTVINRELKNNYSLEVI